MNQRTKILLLILVFTAFIAAAYFIYTYAAANYKPDSRTAESETKSDAITGAGESEKNTAPDFTVYDEGGNAYRLSDFFGEPIVLNFWASWCPPCKAEMPHFNEVYGEVSDSVTFLMVDLVDGQRETAAKGKAYIEEMGFVFPVYYDTGGDAVSAYGISSIPTSVFIGADGNIADTYIGMMDKQKLLSYIDLID